MQIEVLTVGALYASLSPLPSIDCLSFISIVLTLWNQALSVVLYFLLVWGVKKKKRLSNQYKHYADVENKTKNKRPPGNQCRTLWTLSWECFNGIKTKLNLSVSAETFITVQIVVRSVYHWIYS